MNDVWNQVNQVVNRQLDLTIQQGEKALSELIEENADASEIAGAFRAFIAGVKGLAPAIDPGPNDHIVRRYKLVYNYSSVELEVGGTLEEAEAVISAEYSALKRMSDGPEPLQPSWDGWEPQEAPPEWDNGGAPYEGPTANWRSPPSYQGGRPSYGGSGKRPLSDKERAFARKLGMQDAFNPNIDPSAVRRWIQAHK